jgi:hypothetical protein
MSFLNANSFLDRQAAAAKAKKDMAEKFLSRPKYDPNDPAVLEREAKRREILEGRAAREVERQKRKAEAEGLRLEALAREATEASRRAEEERLEYEKKLERDARYAARKDRKQKKKSVGERWG